MRNSLFGLGVLVLACVATLSLNAQQAGIVQPTTKWEYRSAFTPGSARDTKEANTLGGQGWELVSVVGLPQDQGSVVMYFKRPVR